MCNFAASFDREERPNESAFSPYSDSVNLDNLHIYYDAWNIGVTRCSIGLYHIVCIHSLWSNLNSIYIFESLGF